MKKEELKMVIAVAVVILLIWLLALKISNSIENAGGVKQIIIDTGKEVKDIAQQINKD